MDRIFERAAGGWWVGDELWVIRVGVPVFVYERPCFEIPRRVVAALLESIEGALRLVSPRILCATQIYIRAHILIPTTPSTYPMVRVDFEEMHGPRPRVSPNRYLRHEHPKRSQAYASRWNQYREAKIGFAVRIETAAAFFDAGDISPDAIRSPDVTTFDEYGRYTLGFWARTA